MEDNEQNKYILKKMATSKKKKRKKKKKKKSKFLKYFLISSLVLVLIVLGIIFGLYKNVESLYTDAYKMRQTTKNIDFSKKQ
ncbi:MAG: hypothetical protein ACK5LM_03270, partial [Lactovum sp.]